VDESDFLDWLKFEDLRERYHGERGRRLGKVRTSFEGDEEGIRRDIEAGIDSDRRHREVLNLAVNLFANPAFGPYRLGYRFVHGAPLHELGVPNFDFLVARMEGDGPVAILGEAKGSVSSPARTVQQTRERHEVALEHIDRIRETYLRTDADPRVEVVLAVPAIGAQRVIEAIEDSGGGIIPWMTDTGENIVTLELPRATDGKLRSTMLHSDRGLNGALERARSVDRGFDVFPQSPPFTKLRLLVVHATREGQRYYVDRDVISTRLGKELFYLDDGQVQALVDETFEMGFDVGVLKEVEGRPALSMRWGNRQSMEGELRRAWVDHRCGHELNRRVDQTIDELQEEFRGERVRRPSLEVFDDQGHA
jgi:hypothetical protein